MSNVLVSLRIPASLADRLKAVVAQGSYMDVSELVRSIVRQKYEAFQNPQLMQLRKLREEITQAMKEKNLRLVQEQLIQELEDIKKQVLGEKG